LKLWILAVGRPKGLLAEAIGEFERRAARYWNLEVVEIREERARKGLPPESVRAAESASLMERLPRGAETVALTRTGDAWSSSRLAKHLEDVALHGREGVAFLIGGALGLDDETLRRADRRMRISTFTLPHELARLVLAEQLYRAGTILRGEPYHKGAD
jgi:23S rRNA (pseudouridine1915-N3)-methyltransferase